jgi:hypothetical protein
MESKLMWDLLPEEFPYEDEEIQMCIDSHRLRPPPRNLHSASGALCPIINYLECLVAN